MTSGQFAQANSAMGNLNIGSAFSAVPGTKTPAVTVPCVLVSDTKGKWEQFYYCWTHGLGFNKDHTSLTCTKKAEGHKEDATILNMQGGNNTIRRQQGERAVWKPLPRQPRCPSTPRANGARGDTPPPATPSPMPSDTNNSATTAGRNDSPQQE